MKWLVASFVGMILLVGVGPHNIKDINSPNSIDVVVPYEFDGILKTYVAEATVAYPRQIAIPKIKVNAPVLAMGITLDGKMAVPDDYRNVGWYKFGTRPGEVGSAVIGAHVDNGAAISGVFKKLKYLKIGDEITITNSDGEILKYKVNTTKVFNYKTLDTTEVFLKNDNERLNLITCHGTWLPQENTYNKRLVVFAERVN
jgi:sortase A